MARDSVRSIAARSKRWVVTQTHQAVTATARRCTRSASRSTGASRAASRYIAINLDAVLGDANTQTPEFKSFIVTIEKV